MSAMPNNTFTQALKSAPADQASRMLRIESSSTSTIAAKRLRRIGTTA